MDDLALLWLTRIGGLLFALVAGWLMGHATPSWREDDRLDEFARDNRGMGVGGDDGGGCVGGVLVSLIGWLRETPLGAACLIAAGLLAWYGWQLEDALSQEGGTVGANSDALLLLFQRGVWWTILALVGGYIAAVVSAHRRENP